MLRAIGKVFSVFSACAILAGRDVVSVAIAAAACVLGVVVLSMMWKEQLGWLILLALASQGAGSLYILLIGGKYFGAVSGIAGAVVVGILTIFAAILCEGLRRVSRVM